jgi:hypothetical protein
MNNKKTSKKLPYQRTTEQGSTVRPYPEGPIHHEATMSADPLDAKSRAITMSGGHER